MADDVTRRTFLAAERTWLAWWRSGIATATAAVGVGGVVPQLVGGARAPYVVLGAGYALVAVAVFAMGWLRQRQGRESLERGEYAQLAGTWVAALSVAAGALALATFVVVVAQP